MQSDLLEKLREPMPSAAPIGTEPPLAMEGLSGRLKARRAVKADDGRSQAQGESGQAQETAPSYGGVGLSHAAKSKDLPPEAPAMARRHDFGAPEQLEPESRRQRPKM